eukprot:comp21912_c0_seq1/m.49791 comp21912_c0_seq1/g.49791  ORF comp21912_c0_seq1/g.49791 comp21912_c0_seq1/m.49791 type:complete len:323 (-) comp21912_c0_seq1:1330-2298(-)
MLRRRRPAPALPLGDSSSAGRVGARGSVSANGAGPFALPGLVVVVVIVATVVAPALFAALAAGIELLLLVALLLVALLLVLILLRLTLVLVVGVLGAFAELDGRELAEAGIAQLGLQLHVLQERALFVALRVVDVEGFLFLGAQGGGAALLAEVEAGVALDVLGRNVERAALHKNPFHVLLDLVEQDEDLGVERILFGIEEHGLGRLAVGLLGMMLAKALLLVRDGCKFLLEAPLVCLQHVLEAVDHIHHELGICDVEAERIQIVANVVCGLGNRLFKEQLLGLKVVEQMVRNTNVVQKHRLEWLLENSAMLLPVPTAAAAA